MRNPFQMYEKRLRLTHVNGSLEPGLRVLFKNQSSALGQVLHGRDGKWHMLAAEIVNHCGINAWTRNSRVVHAISDIASGLYARVAPMRPVFAHEPTLDRAPDGTYVIAEDSFR